MGKRDPRVDAYIASAPDYAQPILTHLRAVIHRTVPTVEKTMKWNFPHFTYKGMFRGMAAFKEYCSFGFWRQRLLIEPVLPTARRGMGQFGKLTSVRDLPPTRKLEGYIKTAAANIDADIKPPRRPRTKRAPIVVPADFRAALRTNTRAAATFDGFSPTNRWEYVEWITEAKRPETRQRRFETAIEWLAAGKSRNWKYQK
jgi:uncharacterized protein YdeI (YjbR/CyaY-like superfamily)